MRSTTSPSTPTASPRASATSHLALTPTLPLSGCTKLPALLALLQRALGESFEYFRAVAVFQDLELDRVADCGKKRVSNGAAKGCVVDGLFSIFSRLALVTSCFFFKSRTNGWAVSRPIRVYISTAGGTST